VASQKGNNGLALADRFQQSRMAEVSFVCQNELRPSQMPMLKRSLSSAHCCDDDKQVPVLPVRWLGLDGGGSAGLGFMGPRFFARLAHDECFGNEPKQEDVDARSCLGWFWALYSTVADEGRAMDWPYRVMG